MILADTSVWVDHFRRGNGSLGQLLPKGLIQTHPFVIGELACGQLKRRPEILGFLSRLPPVPVAEHHEVLALIDAHRLWGTGIGWIDSHLLASAMLAGGKLWTLDRALASAAGALQVAANF